MNPEPEIRRLLDVMPASGRMLTKIVSKPEQSRVIYSQLPLPWHRERPIYINFDLWRELSKPQRDLLILSTVSWLTNIKWFKPDIYQGVVLAGVLGGIMEFVQADAIGVVVAGGLSAIAGSQIWRSNRSQEALLDADRTALQIAQRRGYTEAEAAQYLLSGMEAIAQIEGRSSLSFNELIRCQNLKAIAGFSAVGIPNNK